MLDEGLSVKFTGDPTTAEVRFNRELIPVWEIDISVSVDRKPYAVITLPLQKLEYLDGNVVWIGMDEVPIKVLEAMLEQRKNDNA